METSCEYNIDIIDKMSPQDPKRLEYSKKLVYATATLILDMFG